MRRRLMASLSCTLILPWQLLEYGLSILDVLPATTVDEGAIFAVLRCCCAVDVVPTWGG